VATTKAWKKAGRTTGSAGIMTRAATGNTATRTTDTNRLMATAVIMKQATVVPLKTGIARHTGPRAYLHRVHCEGTEEACTEPTGLSCGAWSRRRFFDVFDANLDPETRTKIMTANGRTCFLGGSGRPGDR